MSSSFGEARPWLRAEALVPLGLLLCTVGMFLPWLVHWPVWRDWGPQYHWAPEITGALLDGLTGGGHSRLLTPEWWWSLPLVDALALPALWCSRRRGDLGATLVISWLWIALVLLAMAWLAWCLPSAFDIVERRHRSMHLAPGFMVSATGAVLVGLVPVLELQSLRRRFVRWRRRPGRDQARRAIDPHALRRLPHALRGLVREARALRADLTPQRSLDTQHTRMLADIIRQLRGLDDECRAELRDHGLTAEGLLERLAPDSPPQWESGFEEILRVDEALTRLAGIGLRGDGPAPYR